MYFLKRIVFVKRHVWFFRIYIIQISFVGYKTLEISWDGSPINVTLKDDSQALEEVVVVGYGTQKKVNLTGAVAMTEGDMLEDRPIANLAQGLQGAIPNLNITMPSGNPNATATFNVRGITSLNGGSALILVDGVETNDISLLNPQDIESVSVLKDASSAAVYGARAAFGVVLITTKKGSKGQKVTINYNNNFSWSTPSRLPDGISSDKWIDAVQLANTNTNGSGYFSQALVDAVHAYCQDPSRPSAFLDETGEFTAKGQWAYAGNTDWFDEFYKSAAFMQQHNASIQGGTEKNTYYGSIGYKGQDGLLAFGTDTYKRINMSFCPLYSVITINSIPNSQNITGVNRMNRIHRLIWVVHRIMKYIVHSRSFLSTCLMDSISQRWKVVTSTIIMLVFWQRLDV